jgi:hypothetical protein
MPASPRLSFYLRDCDRKKEFARPVPLRWIALTAFCAITLQIVCLAVQSFCLSGFGITPSAASDCDALSCTVGGSLAQRDAARAAPQRLIS